MQRIDVKRAFIDVTRALVIDYDYLHLYNYISESTGIVVNEIPQDSPAQGSAGQVLRGNEDGAKTDEGAKAA